jgi:tRNA nucleotidyltransferase (CCA-adding enzyme)
VDRQPDAATDPAGAIPPDVLEVLQELWSAGEAAYVVGGSLRDVFLGRLAADWDLATSARPDRMLDLFPGAVYENRFGTVAIRRGREVYEATTFRSDHEYADFRRPHRIEFGDSIDPDLARRDFTVNAMAWGRRPDEPAPGLVDPFGGRSDAARRLLRAVGEPERRFDEDALRMVRAVRLAAALDFEVEAATLAAITARSELVRHLSGERIAAELDKLLAVPAPSRGLRMLADTGILGHIAPELAEQRGVPQNKVPGEDLWDHTLRTVDAAPRDRPLLRLAALLHDIGKPATAADGHFYGHERAGADLAQQLLERLHYPRAVIDRVVTLVRQHMFSYEDSWSDTAVRRFIGKIKRPGLEELFELRRADNLGSGLDADATGLAELRARVDAQLAAEVAIDLHDLAIDGDDLLTELGLEPGPGIGRLLDGLLDRVLADPALNDRPTLLLLARTMLETEE